MSQEARNVIGVYRLAKDYDGKRILRDVNLQVANGEFVFLVGPSGAGKSSLLRMIYVDEYPTEGQVIVGSFVSTQLKRRHIPYLRRKIGIVFQDFKLLDDRNVFENVAIALRVCGISNFEMKKRVMQVLTQVGLYHKRNNLPGKLSGGEQQRISIARAEANHPAILLADEPTGNLDPDVTAEILQLLFEINAGGTAVLMATHNHALVKSFRHRVVHLRDGTIHEDRHLGEASFSARRLGATPAPSEQAVWADRGRSNE